MLNSRNASHKSKNESEQRTKEVELQDLTQNSASEQIPDKNLQRDFTPQESQAANPQRVLFKAADSKKESSFAFYIQEFSKYIKAYHKLIRERQKQAPFQPPENEFNSGQDWIGKTSISELLLKMENHLKRIETLNKIEKK